jgi:hypothetical protein
VKKGWLPALRAILSIPRKLGSGLDSLGRHSRSECLRPTVLALLAAVLCGGCQERGRPDPNIPMAASHERETAGRGSSGEAGAGATGAPKVPTRLVVPPEVGKTYSAIRLTWKDSGGGREGTLDVPLGGSARIPNSDLEVRADVFLPAFTMAAEEITSKGVELSNPAARITVLEKGNEIFSGWIFTNFPNVHPFEHPRFSVRLAGAVKKRA